MNLIKSDASASEKFKETGEVSGTMINFLFEKQLVQESVADTRYDELFLDVTNGNISFLKFDLNSKGKIHYYIESAKNRVKKAKLRSKQGVERRSSKGSLKLDKLGFQP
jgi:hypothetical protein